MLLFPSPRVHTFHIQMPPIIEDRIRLRRLDWNLLSTATPAIKAWMNPTHNLTEAVTDLLRKYKYRLNTVMACIMTEALEVQGIHVPAKVGRVSWCIVVYRGVSWCIMAGDTRTSLGGWCIEVYHDRGYTYQPRWVVYDGVSWCIMVYRGVSWCIMAGDTRASQGGWCTMVYPGVSWCIVVYHGVSWQGIHVPAKVGGVPWCILVYHGVSWCIMVYHGRGYTYQPRWVVY